MAEFPALTLWTDAYLSDTRRLTTLEHGAYLLLLMEAWRRPNCDLPDNDRQLAHMAGLSAEDWAAIKPTIMVFWKRDGRRKVWMQKRLTLERDKARTRGKVATDKARKRWNKTKITDAAAMPETCNSNAITTTTTTTATEVEEEEGAKAPPSGASARAEKSEPFPRPEWADGQVWSDFLLNRKTKKARNTATAYAGQMSAIAKLTNNEWPPGRLLEYAASHGWAGIYEPKEGYPANGRSDRQQNSRPERRTTRESGERVAMRFAAAASGGVVDLVPRLGQAGRDDPG